MAALNELMAQLRDNDPAVRRRAIEELAQKADRGTVDALIRSLESSNELFKTSVIIALGKIEDRAASDKYLEVLRKDLESDEVNLRAAAIYTIMENRNPLALPLLYEALKDPYKFIRDSAERAIRRIEKANPGSLDLLRVRMALNQVIAGSGYAKEVQTEMDERYERIKADVDPKGISQRPTERAPRVKNR